MTMEGVTLRSGRRFTIPEMGMEIRVKLLFLTTEISETFEL